MTEAEALAARLKLAPGRLARRRTVQSRRRDPKLRRAREAVAGRVRPELTRGDVYAPYWWDVRLFTLGSIDETVIRFKPDGMPNGFAHRVAETYVRDPATKALPAATAPRARRGTRARRLGRRFRALSIPRAIAADAKERPRRPQRSSTSDPNNWVRARVRLRLVVAGDELTGAPAVRIHPESFGRRFQELRSANNLIANIAGASAGVLYGLGGTILGRAVAAAATLARMAAGVRCGTDRRGLMAWRILASTPAAVVRRRHDRNDDDVLAEAGRRRDLPLHRRADWVMRLRSWRPSRWRAARFRNIRSCGGSGRARRAPRSKSSDARWAATCSCRSSSRSCMLFYYATNRWLGWWQPSGDAVGSQHFELDSARAVADRDFAAGRVHGGVRVSSDSARAGRIDRRALRSPPPRNRHRVRVAGAGVRRRARQLPGLSVVFAAGRVDRAVDDLGADLSALRASCRRCFCTRCST